MPNRARVIDDPAAGSEAHRIAARVRAAVAYCGESFERIGQRSGLGVAKLRRIASAAEPRGATPLELWGIADACGVPRTWLEVGQWDDAAGQPEIRPITTSPFGQGDVEARLELIERYLFALLRIEEMRGEPLPPLLESGRSPRTPARAAPQRSTNPKSPQRRNRRAADS